MLTPAHRRILETLADPERRAGLRPEEREAVRAALGLEAEVERLTRERAEADHATVAARLDALHLECERDEVRAEVERLKDLMTGGEVPSP